MHLKKIILNRRGSTLIWVMIISLVILFIATTLLISVTAHNRKATQEKIDTQAYYTAFSGAKAVQGWFVAGAGDADSSAKKFLDDLRTATDKTLVFEFPKATLGDELGDCTVTVQYTNPENTEISLRSEGRYADSKYILEVGLSNDSLKGKASKIDPKTFDTSAYDTYADSLNAFVPDPKPLIVGRDNPLASGGVNATVLGNNADYAAISSAGINASSNREVLYDRPRANDTYGDEIIGTFRSQIDRINEPLYFDYRQFAVPPNGLLTVNPLRYGEYAGQDAPSKSSTASTNTRLSTFSIGNTAGKDIKIRLAGQNYNQIYGNNSSSYNFNLPTNRYYNGLVAFDFTDSVGNTEYRSDVRYFENEMYSDTNAKNLYHPINWNSGTIYTQQTTNAVYNSGLYSRLVFSGFYHKYDYFGDYWGSSAYMANPWYGQNYQDFKKSSPGMTDARANTSGMPFLPVFYGPNFNLYLLDDDANNAGALLMQGVNIVDGTIYSKRGLQLGGAMVPTNTGGSGQTKHNVNNDAPGINEGVDPVYGNLAVRTMRWDQQIVNTDIVLLAPAGKTRNSEIFAPESAADPALKKTGIDTMTKAAKPIETILGGTIYVGSGQTLTIHGTVAYNAGRMRIAPDKIIVDKGAKVIVEESTSQNIDTKFYVNGGTLQINNKANLKADILVYGGGTLSLGGGASAPVNAQFTLTPKTAGIGIIIAAEDSIDENGKLVGKGSVTALNNSTQIIESASSKTKVGIHYLAGTTTKQSPPTQLAPADQTCSPAAPNHFCSHFGGAVDVDAWSVISVKEGL